MLLKNTMTIVATKLAEEKILAYSKKLDKAYDARCDLLDSRLAGSLREAFIDEKISQVRMQRIVDRFCDNMLDSKKIDEAL